MGITRKEFLKNAAAAAAALTPAGMALRSAGSTERPLRPPGALPEEEFLSVCIRCGRCADACPNQAIAAFTADSGRRFSMRPGPGEEGDLEVVEGIEVIVAHRQRPLEQRRGVEELSPGQPPHLEQGPAVLLADGVEDVME